MQNGEMGDLDDLIRQNIETPGQVKIEEDEKERLAVKQHFNKITSEAEDEITRVIDLILANVKNGKYTHNTYFSKILHNCD